MARPETALRDRSRTPVRWRLAAAFRRTAGSAGDASHCRDRPVEDIAPPDPSARARPLRASGVARPAARSRAPRTTAAASSSERRSTPAWRCRASGSPSMLIVPLSGSVTPASRFSSVDLPHPMKPTMETNSPRRPTGHAIEHVARTGRCRMISRQSVCFDERHAHSARSLASAMPIMRSSRKPTMPIVRMASRMCE